MARTNNLTNFLTDVADAIRNKIGSSIPIQASQFDTEIENIPSGGGADLNDYFNMTPTAEELTNTDSWVKNNYVKKFSELTIPDNISNISNLCSGANVCPKIICNSNVTNMSYLYSAVTAKTIDLSGLDTSGVTNVNNMFAGIGISTIDISNLNLLKKGTTTVSQNNLFDYSTVIEKVIVTPKIENHLYRWFRGCPRLKTLVLLRTDAVCTYSSTFSSCYHMDGTVNPTYNPEGLKDGRIYVPDNLVNSYKSASGWSTYADQILPLSQYVDED